MTQRSLFTSESVFIGHPDKVADQISDAILDACLEQDPLSRVACETLVSTGLVVLAGEITTKAHIDYQAIVRQVIREIGYNDSALGFDYKSCAVLNCLNKQSSDIALGVDKTTSLYGEQGAGDQGMMFGYACTETEVLMPLPINLSHAISCELLKARQSGEIPYLKPDGKCQVTVEYSKDGSPLRVDTIVISTQHDENTPRDTIVKDMEHLARHTIPSGLIDEKTNFYINPTGRFVVGGPAGDCGLTGRKIIVDTYGGMGRHGGGAFSGKDPTKVDRSASYAARYIAKNIVAAKLATRCEVQISYVIGVPYPVSIKIDTFNTNTVPEEWIVRAVPKVFNLSPCGIIEMLNLQRPIYQKMSFGGHFGRKEKEAQWERVDRVGLLLEMVAIEKDL